MSKRIAILGSGLSGLFAAWACEQSGEKDYLLFTNDNKKPVVRGFQYLHRDCGMMLKPYILHECVMPDSFPIDVCSRLYSLKVYNTVDVHNSISRMDMHQEAKQIYNLSEAVNRIWPLVKDKMVVRNFENMQDALTLSYSYDVVLSSIPIHRLDWSWQQNWTKYKSVKAWAMVLDTETRVNEVFYDVRPDSQVYRYGTLFGQFFLEANSNIFGDLAIPLDKVFGGEAPQPPSPKIHFIGRYGEWNKTILVHDVYMKVMGILNGPSGRTVADTKEIQ